MHRIVAVARIRGGPVRMHFVIVAVGRIKGGPVRSATSGIDRQRSQHRIVIVARITGGPVRIQFVSSPSEESKVVPFAAPHPALTGDVHKPIDKEANKSSPKQSAIMVNFRDAVDIVPETDMTLQRTLDANLPYELNPLFVNLESSGYGLILVLRGVAGIGKSTLAKKIYQWCQSANVTCVVCNADVWHYDHDGTYHWQGGDQLTNAHDHSKARFLLGIAMKNQVIVVDNTNLRHEHYHWYEDHYNRADYNLEVVEIECRDDRVAHAATDRALRAGHVGPTYDTMGSFRLFHTHRDPRAIVVQPTFRAMGAFEDAMVIDPAFGQARG